MGIALRPAVLAGSTVEGMEPATFGHENGKASSHEERFTA